MTQLSNGFTFTFGYFLTNRAAKETKYVITNLACIRKKPGPTGITFRCIESWEFIVMPIGDILTMTLFNLCSAVLAMIRH